MMRKSLRRNGPRLPQLLGVPLLAATALLLGTAAASDAGGLLRPVPRLSVTDVAVKEADSGRTSAVFTVRLSRASATPVRVRFATVPTVGQSATAGTDYVARRGLLVFKPRETRKKLRIEVIADTLPEGDESFDLRLTAPIGARIAPYGGRATIAFNDLPGRFTLRADMGGAQAVPSQAASYSGTATITLDPAAARLSFTITVSGASGATEGVFTTSDPPGQPAAICGCGSTLVAKLAPVPPIPGSSSGSDISISRESIIALYNDPSRFAVSVSGALGLPAASELMRGQLSRVG
jgi:Calx-beta domain-containing protein